MCGSVVVKINHSYLVSAFTVTLMDIVSYVCRALSLVVQRESRVGSVCICGCYYIFGWMFARWRGIYEVLKLSWPTLHLHPSLLVPPYLTPPSTSLPSSSLHSP